MVKLKDAPIPYNDQLSAVCPQQLDYDKDSGTAHPHNSNYKALRSASQNPEPQTYPKAMKFQKVHRSGQVPMKLVKEQFGT